MPVVTGVVDGDVDVVVSATVSVVTGAIDVVVDVVVSAAMFASMSSSVSTMAIASGGSDTISESPSGADMTASSAPSAVEVSAELEQAEARSVSASRNEIVECGLMQRTSAGWREFLTGERTPPGGFLDAETVFGNASGAKGRTDDRERGVARNRTVRYLVAYDLEAEFDDVAVQRVVLEPRHFVGHLATDYVLSSHVPEVFLVEWSSAGRLRDGAEDGRDRHAQI